MNAFRSVWTCCILLGFMSVGFAQQPSRLEEARQLGSRVGQLRLAGKFAEAAAVLEKKLAIERDVLGNESPRAIETLEQLAAARQDAEDFDAARVAWKEALGLRTKAQGAKHWRTVSTRINLAHMERVAALRPEQRTRLAQAEELDTQAQALYWRGVESPKALRLARDALQARTELLTEEDPVCAASLNNVGVLSKRMGLVRLVRGDAKEAVALFREAEQIFREVKDSEGMLACLNNRALVGDVTGDYAAAEGLLREVVKQRGASAYARETPLYANSISNLALLDILLGKRDEAESLLREALRIRQKRTPDHPSLAVNLDNLAILAQVRGDSAQADSLVRQALALARRHLDLAAQTQAERQQIALAIALRGYLDHYLSLPATTKGQDATTYQQVLAWKGSVLSRQRRQRDWQCILRESNSKEIATLCADLDRTARRLAVIALNAPEWDLTPKIRQNLIEKLTEQKEQLERELSRRSAEFRRQQDAPAVTVAMVTATLPPDTVLIDYLEYDHSAPPPGKGGDRGKVERRLTAFILEPGKARGRFSQPDIFYRFKD
jgi:tetratricopeptide (TPR) repeat protein